MRDGHNLDNIRSKFDEVSFAVVRELVENLDVDNQVRQGFLLEKRRYDVQGKTTSELKVLVEAAPDEAERISAHLARAGIYPRRLEPVGSGLEDFFLDLMASEPAGRVPLRAQDNK